MHANLSYPSQFNLKVAKEKKGKVVDAKCRDLTNSAVCEKGRKDPGSVELCDWHEVRFPVLSIGPLHHFICYRLELGESGTWAFDTTRNLDLGRHFAVWT